MWIDAYDLDCPDKIDEFYSRLLDKQRKRSNALVRQLDSRRKSCTCYNAMADANNTNTNNLPIVMDEMHKLKDRVTKIESLLSTSSSSVSPTTSVPSIDSSTEDPSPKLVPEAKRRKTIEYSSDSSDSSELSCLQFYESSTTAFAYPIECPFCDLIFEAGGNLALKQHVRRIHGD